MTDPSKPEIWSATGVAWHRGRARILQTRSSQRPGFGYVLCVGYERFPQVDDLAEAQAAGDEATGDTGPWETNASDPTDEGLEVETEGDELVLRMKAPGAVLECRLDEAGVTAFVTLCGDAAERLFTTPGAFEGHVIGRVGQVTLQVGDDGLVVSLRASGTVGQCPLDQAHAAAYLTMCADAAEQYFSRLESPEAS